MKNTRVGDKRNEGRTSAKKQKKIRGGADVLKLIGKRERLLVFVNVI